MLFLFVSFAVTKTKYLQNAFENPLTYVTANEILLNVCVLSASVCNFIIKSLSVSHVTVSIQKTNKQKPNSEITLTSTTNTSSSTTSTSFIKCVSPNLVTGTNNSFVVVEAIYYDSLNSNQFVLAKVKNAQTNTINANANANVNASESMLTMTKCEQNVAQKPIIVTSVAQNSNNLATPSTPSTTNGGNGNVVKKPGIILLTQASLSKLLQANDLNVINNNHFNGRNRNNENDDANATKMNSTNRIIIAPSNIHANNINISQTINSTNHTDNNNIKRILTTSNHVHAHHTNENNTNIVNQIQIQNNNPFKTVLMINSTSTSMLETAAGIVTITPTTGSLASVPIKRENTDDDNQQVSFGIFVDFALKTQYLTQYSHLFQASDNAATKNQTEEVSNCNLPATPEKSGDGDSNAATIKPDNANVNDNAMDDDEAISDDDKEEEEFEYREDYEDSVSADDEQRFVLAPTPAQLGQAPKQRRMGSLVGGDANSKIPLTLYTMNSYT